ncbi:MAG: DinB family protein [candidate division Zixibacteria bacterium]|nr:DinB family protein [candidate division Zixibacteria bacterium]
MTPAERSRLIESYGQAFDLLTEALPTFPRDMWHYKPAPDRWSIHEIIVHLAESEANSYIRARCFISEPGKTVMAYDQDRWAIEGHYSEQDVATALETFKWLRESTYRVIRRLPEKVWSNTVNHPEHGVMHFDKWLEIYEDHTRKHIGQMRRNYDSWLATQK